MVYGLGNPGIQYAHTRHNIGFMVVDELSSRLDVAMAGEKFAVRWGRGVLNGHEFVLAKPQTYMNRSGEPFRNLPVQPQNLIVVYDDMDLPLGQIRVRQRGSAGGHKGMQSIIDTLETTDFVRVRCGIGRSDIASGVTDYVLGNFGEDEKQVLEEELDLAADAVMTCILDGPQSAMNVYNRRTRE